MDILKKISENKERMKAITKEMEAVASVEEPTKENDEQLDALAAEFDELEKDCSKLEQILERRKKVESFKPIDTQMDSIQKDLPVIHATAKQIKSRYFSTDEKAYKFGMFIGALAGNRKCQEHAVRLGYEAALYEKDNVTGGYLVPDEHSSDLIKNIERYGVFRAKTRVRPMASDTLNIPVNKGGTTAYWVGEGNQITASKSDYDNVKLIAKKLAAIVNRSNEVSADAAINLGDDVIDDISRAIAYAEDNAAFNGDGTSSYGGIVGLTTRFTDTYSTSAGVGQVLAAGNTAAEVTLANLDSMVAALPQYAMGEWYCSQWIYGNVLERLKNAAGGNTNTSLTAGSGRQYGGYPVNIVQVMPTSDSNSQHILYFGDMRLATCMGDRQQFATAVSTEGTVNDINLFEQDMMAVRGIERVDIAVHDTGTSSTAGPMIALISAAS